jgi:hypothetical protein
LEAAYEPKAKRFARLVVLVGLMIVFSKSHGKPD